MIKRIVLCADDYGQAPPISEGIMDLVQQRRLSAVSCMANMPCFPEHALWLKPFCNDLDVGLHFNLTEGEGAQSLLSLMWASVSRRLSSAVIERQFEQQIDQFIAAFDRLPRFIDGHQHVHQFPIVREACLRVYQRRFIDEKPYFRLSAQALKPSDYIFAFKKVMIDAMGAKAFKQALVTQDIPFPTSFGGVYDFADAVDYPRFFPQFLASIHDKGLIMCHPGKPTTRQYGDAIAAARAEEYRYLLSEQFLADCQRANVQLARF